MKAIVAICKNGGIGKNDTLPWPKISQDFKWFKEFTLNKICVAGKNTYMNLPILKNRRLVILNRSQSMENSWNPLLDTAICHLTLESIIELDKRQELICIGGARTYEALLPYITEFWVTHVNGEYDCDTFLPMTWLEFKYAEHIKDLPGGHMIIKYSNNL